MSIDFLNAENPFFKEDIDKLCLICYRKFKINETPHLISDRLEQTQSDMNIYDALESISNFKEIKLIQQAQKVCEFCYENISTVIKFREMCNKSASFLKSYIHYQEMNNSSQSLISLPETYIDRPMSPKLRDANVLSIKSEVLNDYEEQDIWPEFVAINTVDSLSSTGETMLEKEETSKHNMLNEVVEQDVKLEVCSELTTITTFDTFEEEKTIKQEIRNISEKEISNVTCLDRPTLTTTATSINTDKAIVKEKYEKKIVKGVHKVKCTMCDRFYSKTYMPTHLRLHTDEKAFSCEICGMTFKTSSSKWSHKLIHKDPNEPQDSPCTICGKSSNMSSRLRKRAKNNSSEGCECK